MPEPMMPSPKIATRGFDIDGLSQGNDANECRASCRGAQRIAQWPPKAFEADLHYVSVGQLDAFAEAEAIRTEIMDVHVSGPPVPFKLELMMLNVLQAVAHLG